MTTEMKILAGKCCKCNGLLEMRIDNVKDEEQIFGWIIFGVCKKCKVVYMENLFSQSEKPMIDVDFTIDYEKKVEVKRGGKK